jgi:hypothetical protein
MKKFLLRAVILIGAIAFTLFVFGFWGKFGGALDGYLTMVTKPDKPKDTGVVTMTIVQPNQKQSCDKQHPCPKP